jgi:hypothetical protein
MGFSNLWPGFGVGGALKRDLSNPSAHPDSSKHSKYLKGDGTFDDPAGGGGSFSWSSVPASASATGTAGSMAYDSDYLYICVATNTGRRVPLSEWS